MIARPADNQPRKGVPCQVCGNALDSVLPRQGQYTHPTCDPQLELRAVERQNLKPASGSGALLDLYGRPTP